MSHARRTPLALLPYLTGAGAILCWASLAAAIGESLVAVAPETVLFWGLLAAGVALSARELLRRGRDALRGPHAVLAWPGWRVALFGVYGIWGYHTLLVLAFAHAPAVEANIINYTWTLWIVVLGSFQPGLRFSPAIALAGLSGFAGVALVVGGERLAAGGFTLGIHGREAWFGFALALGASGVWSSFTVYMRRVVPPGREPMPLFCLLSAGAALVLLVLRGASLALPPAHAPAVLYLGLVPLGLSFLLWEHAARRAQLQVLGLMSFFTPLLSTWLLALVSGREVSGTLYAGLGLILLGAAQGSIALRKQSA